jgi:hypothetical protein
VGSRTVIVAHGDADIQHVLRAAPVLDRPGTLELVGTVFPEMQLDEVGDALLLDSLDPPDGAVYAGCFPDLDLLCTRLLVGERPSETVKRYPRPHHRPNTYLLVLDSDTSWCAFGMLREGELVRSLSVTPERVYENIGDPLPFELPFCEGEREPDPLALGEEALHAFFGFRLQGMDSVDDVDPEVIPLVGYRIS